MKEKETYRGLLKEAFKPYKVDTQEDLWPLINTQLQEKSEAKSTAYWNLVLPLAASVLLLLGLWFMWRSGYLSANEIDPQPIVQVESNHPSPIPELEQSTLTPTPPKKEESRDELEEEVPIREKDISSPKEGVKRNGPFTQELPEERKIPPSSRVLTAANSYEQEKQDVDIAPNDIKEEEILNKKLTALPIAKVSSPFSLSVVENHMTAPKLPRAFYKPLLTQRNSSTSENAPTRSPKHTNESKLDSMILFASRTMSQLIGNEESVKEQYDSNSEEEYRSFSIKIGAFTFSKKHHKKILN